MSNPPEPDYVSEKPGEHGDFIDNATPHEFALGKRVFDVEFEEAANGVWHASTEVHKSGRNGRVFHPHHAPYPVDPNEVEPVSETGATPSEALEALKSVVEAM